MKSVEFEKLNNLVKYWISIAERLENDPVKMTANTHRLFANELSAVLSRMQVDSPTQIHVT